MPKLKNFLQDLGSAVVPAAISAGATYASGGTLNPATTPGLLKLLAAVGSGARGFAGNEAEERRRKQMRRQAEEDRRAQGMANLINALQPGTGARTRPAEIAAPKAGLGETLARGTATGIDAFTMAKQAEEAWKDRELQRRAGEAGLAQIEGSDAATLARLSQSPYHGPPRDRTGPGVVDPRTTQHSLPPSVRADTGFATAEGPPRQGMQVDSLYNAIVNKESSGDSSAVNKDSGAIGLGQVMPANIPAWSNEILGRSLTPEEFLSDPNAQEAVVRGKLMQFYTEELQNANGDIELATKRTAARWYSGNPELFNNTSPQNGYPPVKTYSDDIYSRVQQAMSTGYRTGEDRGIYVMPETTVTAEGETPPLGWLTGFGRTQRLDRQLDIRETSARSPLAALLRKEVIRLRDQDRLTNLVLENPRAFENMSEDDQTKVLLGLHSTNDPTSIEFAKSITGRSLTPQQTNQMDSSSKLLNIMRDITGLYEDVARITVTSEGKITEEASFIPGTGGLGPMATYFNVPGSEDQRKINLLESQLGMLAGAMRGAEETGVMSEDDYNRWKKLMPNIYALNQAGQYENFHFVIDQMTRSLRAKQELLLSTGYRLPSLELGERSADIDDVLRHAEQGDPEALQFLQYGRNSGLFEVER